ncbi:hypothetical protein DFH07DRAFT_891638 [Mycena maculata]|uniref:DUF4203 domain-containing protein n=1 Tax=Mycena maculata TaxID=230809 RepID=A0AAD7IF53_9AGAR|nr:hypothetical protein DFH07DRAFT_891638 [Mycena maculata]
MAMNDSTSLTLLLPSTSYLLAYALPLLFLSIVLTFAGTFLTLDRTRSFPAERYGVLPGAFEQQKNRFHFLLEGGVGGLIAGYAFGVHLSTFLSLMVPAISTSSPLNSKSFLAVWLLSCLITTFLAGRWRYFALTFVGISGGALFALALAVMIHPSLLARIIITAILSPTLTLFVLLPVPHVQHAAVRAAAASTGAFGLTVSIALLAHIPAWANVWERLWVAEDLTGTWGTSQEKGLTVGFCLFFAAGIASDWLLRRKFGECPDEKWDSYLANYAASLPNAANRAGTFTPLASFWDRLFGAAPPPGPKDVLFPDDADDVKLAPGKNHESFEFTKSPAFLKKGRSVGHARFQARMGGKKRGAVKFRTDGLSSDSDADGENDPLRSPPHSPTVQRPWLRQKMSIASTTPTLVDDSSAKGLDLDKEMGRVRGAKKLRVEGGGAPEYSDFEEEDVTSLAASKDGKEWSPGFLQRHRSGMNAVSSSASQHTTVHSNSSNSRPPTSPPDTRSPPLVPVPATPSLIKALDRIAVAQKDAFPAPAGPEGMPGSPRTNTSPREEPKGARWEDFWKEVRDKAR